MPQRGREQRLIAAASISIAVLASFANTIVLSGLTQRIDDLAAKVETSVARFKGALGTFETEADETWSELLRLRPRERRQAPTPAPSEACPKGNEGLQGIPGLDGEEGEDGAAGAVGADFTTHPELYAQTHDCLICPRGRPGPRGPFGGRDLAPKLVPLQKRYGSLHWQIDVERVEARPAASVTAELPGPRGWCRCPRPSGRPACLAQRAEGDPQAPPDPMGDPATLARARRAPRARSASGARRGPKAGAGGRGWAASAARWAREAREVWPESRDETDAPGDWETMDRTVDRHIAGARTSRPPSAPRDYSTLFKALGPQSVRETGRPGGEAASLQLFDGSPATAQPGPPGSPSAPRSPGRPSSGSSTSFPVPRPRDALTEQTELADPRADLDPQDQSPGSELESFEATLRRLEESLGTEFAAVPPAIPQPPPPQDLLSSPHFDLAQSRAEVEEEVVDGLLPGRAPGLARGQGSEEGGADTLETARADQSSSRSGEGSESGSEPEGGSRRGPTVLVPPGWRRYKPEELAQVPLFHFGLPIRGARGVRLSPGEAQELSALLHQGQHSRRVHLRGSELRGSEPNLSSSEPNLRGSGSESGSPSREVDKTTE